MINFLRTLDLRRIMREVLINREGEVEDAAFVHSLVGLDGKCEVENIVGVGKGHFHGAAKGEFLEVCSSPSLLALLRFSLWLERLIWEDGEEVPRWTRSCAEVTFFFFFPAAASAFSACCCCCFCALSVIVADRGGLTWEADHRPDLQHIESHLPRRRRRFSVIREKTISGVS